MYIVGMGISAGSSLTSGCLATNRKSIECLLQDSKSVIYIAEKLSLKDIGYISNKITYISICDTLTSHVLVSARSAGCCTLGGATGFLIDDKHGGITTEAGIHVSEGETLTLDERSGKLYLGEQRDNRFVINRSKPTMSKSMLVYVSADSVDAVRTGTDAGAGGVGLYRSEGHRIAELFKDKNSNWKDHGITFSNCAKLLENDLEQVLTIANGRPVNYRLLDPDILDVAQRGIRWGLTAGLEFYIAQTRMAIEVASAKALTGCPVDMAIILPYVTFPAEVEYYRTLLMANNILLPVIAPLIKIELGCMVETPAAVETCVRLADQCNVICIGSNDLSATFMALGRHEYGLVIEKYRRLGVLKSDSYNDLKVSGLTAVLRRLNSRLHRATRAPVIYVCGEVLGSLQALPITLSLGFNRISLPCNEIKPAREEYTVAPAISRLEALSMAAGTKSDDNIVKIGGDPVDGQAMAWNWSNRVARAAGLEPPTNWKVFKRDLVAVWFGAPEHKRFAPGWKSESVLDYCRNTRLPGRPVRVSVFTCDIACHSESYVIPDDEHDSMLLFSALDANSLLEVFPQQHEDMLCFRACMDNANCIIEIGSGQASATFEGNSTSNLLAIGLVSTQDNTAFWMKAPSRKCSSSIEEFLAKCGPSLFGRMRAMRAFLCLECVSLEGYFEPLSIGEPVICDLDTPFDWAFMYNNS